MASRNLRMRLADLTPATTQDFIATLAQDVVAGLREVDAAKLNLERLRGARLPLLAMRLQDVQAVTETDWAEHWAPAFTTALEGSGRFSRDAKGRFAGIGPAVSNYKVAVIGLTNGIATLESDSFESYVSRARASANKSGLIKPSAQGAKKGADRKSVQREHAEGGEGMKKATPEQMHRAAAFALADKDKALADMLELAATDYREAFEAWFEGFEAMLARVSKKA